METAFERAKRQQLEAKQREEQKFKERLEKMKGMRISLVWLTLFFPLHASRVYTRVRLCVCARERFDICMCATGKMPK